MITFQQFPTEQIDTKNSKNSVFVFVLLRAIFGFDRGQPKFTVVFNQVESDCEEAVDELWEAADARADEVMEDFRYTTLLLLHKISLL